MEHKIIAAIMSDRENFERIDRHLSNNDLTPEGGIVLKAIRKFYQTDPKADKADLSLVKRKVLRGLQNPKHKEVFEVYLQTVEDQDVSSSNVIQDLLETKRESIQFALAEAILAKDERRTGELLTELSDLSVGSELETAVHEEYQGLDAESLVESFDKDHLIKVLPISLNRRLNGGVLRGHHLVVVAYPETGKTLLCLTMARGFVAQGLKVLYVGNEDPIKAIIMRFVTNLTGWAKDKVEADPDAAIALAKRRGYDNAVFAGVTGGSMEDIKALIVKHEPDVLIVDQIRNLTTTAENRTQQLESVARGMRNFAREFDLVAVSVTQGADSARDKLRLDMGDVDGSNVGIPGAADVMIMMGNNPDYDANDRRYLGLAKNKIGGLHEYWPVNISRHLSRVVDFGKKVTDD